MKIQYATALLVLSLSGNVSSKQALQVNKNSCQSAEFKIAEIKDKQRQGYSIKEGEKLRIKIKQYRALLKNCRKKRFPTK
jgi:hypothetical protein